MSIEQIMQEAVERARGAGCNVMGGGSVADDYVVDLDGDGMRTDINPDTGAGSEPGFSWIGAYHRPERRWLWKISEAQVADWGDGVDELTDKVVRLCSILDGVEEV